MSQGQAASIVIGLSVAVRSEEQVRDDLTRLLDHYERPLFAFLVVMLSDHHRAQDCVQDTFLRAYENLSKGKPVTAAWLYRVARNRAVDEVRRNQREQPNPQPIEETLEESIHPSERSIKVQRALLALSPDDREVLYLAEVDGFTSYEIGEMLGVRAGAVRMRLSRAHSRFRKAYETLT